MDSEDFDSPDFSKITITEKPLDKSNDKPKDKPVINNKETTQKPQPITQPDNDYSPNIELTKDDLVLNEPSEEQKDIINSLKKYNVICDSVAGSGKTTTILNVAKAYPKFNICMLTYNARLKFETRIKADYYNINNIEVNTYHSFACKHYRKGTNTDNKIRAILDENLDPFTDISYDVIIIDEVQDMTPLYYELVNKIVYDNDKGVRIMITGDTHQSIYGFNMADERFLINADKLFKFNNLKWVNKKLSISYRTTDKIAEFINKCVLNEDRIKSVKKSEYKPRYIICNSFIEGLNFGKKSEPPDYTCIKEVIYYIKCGYDLGDIFIISPSVKSSAPPHKLLNYMNEREIRRIINNYCDDILDEDDNVEDIIKKLSNKSSFYISDGNKIDEKKMKDKIAIISYHQAKGLERKVCIVYGVDSGYFETFKTDIIDTVCPNEMYVALTRSKERLSIIHHYTKDYLPFIGFDKLDDYVEFVASDENKKKTHRVLSKRKIYSNELTDYTAELIISNCIKHIVKEELINEDKKIKLFINGIPESVIYDCVYYYYIYITYDKNIIGDKLFMCINKLNKKSREYINLKENGIVDTVNNLNHIKDLEIKHFLRMSYYYNCIKNNNSYLLINDSFDYGIIENDDYVEKINLIMDRLDTVFNFKKCNFNYDEFRKKHGGCQPMIEIEFINNRVIQDIINKFDMIYMIKDSIKDCKVKDISEFMKDNKLSNNLMKLFNHYSPDSKLNVDVSCCIPIYNNDTFTFIVMKDDIENEDIINTCVISIIAEMMYNFKGVNIELYNPLSGKKIKINYDNGKYIYDLLLLNRFIGFKQITNELFIINQSEIYNKYFGDE